MSNDKIPAVVLACEGAPHGDLNVVRSLGEQGVFVIVVSEYPDPHSAASRYCNEFIYIPHFTQDSSALLAALAQIKKKYGFAPVVFPTADPDLAVLNSLQGELDGIAHPVLAPKDLVNALSDKRLFGDMAVRYSLPIPRTFTPRTIEGVEHVVLSSVFPLIIKPPQTNSWSHPDIKRQVANAKAILVQTPEELLEICNCLKPVGLPVLIQEYIPGNDEEHYDVHAYVDKTGQVSASFSGRKWRINPPHAGSGCYVESVYQPALEALAADILKKISFRGIANINFKRHSQTGEFLLMEINARASHWNILAARAGVNLPYIAYLDVSSGEKAHLPQRRYGMFYVNGKVDFGAFRQYHHMGEMSWGTYIKTVMRFGLVYQTLNVRDPMPAITESKKWIVAKIRHVLRRSV